MDDSELGTLTRQGDRWMLTFTRRLAHPREKVWRAVTEPEHLAAWYPQEIVGERRAGAPLRFVSSAGDGFDGQMLIFDPPEVMEFTWGTDRLRIELRADGAGTLLTLIDTFDELGKAARDGAQVPDYHPGLFAWWQRPGGPSHHRAGPRGGQVDDQGILHRRQQPGHDPRGPPGRFGSQLYFDRPDLPGIRAAVDARPVNLRIRDVFGTVGRGPAGEQPTLAVPPGAAVAPRRAGLHPEPGGQDRPQVREPSQCGRAGAEPQASRCHPVPGQPAPFRPRTQPPRGRKPGPPPPGRERG